MFVSSIIDLLQYIAGNMVLDCNMLLARQYTQIGNYKLLTALATAHCAVVLMRRTLRPGEGLNMVAFARKLKGRKNSLLPSFLP